MDDIMQSVKENLQLLPSEEIRMSMYKAFRKTIILGEIPAGTRINEMVFSESLNISRTPIRFALGKLEEEKLVERIPGIGIVTKGITIRDAHEVFEIRAALESLATIKAMNLMTQADFAELEALLEYGNQLNEENRVDELLQNFSDFNQFIYEKSQMVRLRTIVSELNTYFIYFRDISIRASERRTKALNEHWLIFRGMKSRNIEQINMIIEEHLNHSKKFIVQEMEKRHIA
ncbi:MAG: GntR family transcriptional regulator [Streptococcaceae bacterium]|jgi:DNA-binding GntR family transcriptional regulator|nr:GntR family transcriptional regulator [Streptococcaceae bacterium]